VLGRVGEVVGNHSSSFALAGAAAVIVLITGLVLGLRGPAPDESAPVAEAPIPTSVPQPISDAAPPIHPDRTAPSTDVPSTAPSDDDPVTPQAPTSSAPEESTTSPPEQSRTPDRDPTLDEQKPDADIDVPPAATPPPEQVQVRAIPVNEDEAVRQVRIELSGLTESGGVLEVTSNEDRMPVFLDDDACSKMVDGYAVCKVDPNPPPLIVSAITDRIRHDVQLSFTITPDDGSPPDTETYIVEELDREHQHAS
jgi:hypothetical protein